MDLQDKKKADREALLNGVEAYIYKVKELLWTDDIDVYCSGEELPELKELLEKSSDFFEDKGQKATDEELKKLKNDLFVKADPISIRIMEADRRPVFADELGQLLTKLEHDFAELDKVIVDTTIKVGTFKRALKTLNETVIWFNTTLAAQTPLQLHENPVLKVADLKAKIELLKPLAVTFDPKNVQMIKRKPKVQKMKEDLEKTGVTGEALQDMLDALEHLPDPVENGTAKNETTKAKKTNTTEIPLQPEPIVEEEQETPLQPEPVEEEVEDRGEL